MGFYAKARLPRPSIHDPSVRPRRLAVLKAATINLLVLQFLFLGLFCYIFGSLFQQNTHIHNINILFVDYDGGSIGAAVGDAYQELKGPSFPTLDERPPLAYPEPNSIASAVCNIKFWGALYITANSSNDLTAALGGGSAASSYNASDVLTIVWNEARYPATADAVVYDTLATLSEAARVAYMRTNAKQAIQSVNSTDEAALAIYSTPWTLTSVNLQPTSQGSRLIYNTLVIILILIQEFFYLGYVNGLYLQFNLYASVTPHRIAIVRQIISGVYTFVGSLCTSGAIWAFRSGWNVNGGQFMLTWMVLWLFAHLNFLVLDVFTIWSPPPFVPMALISWIVLNVTSILLPFELSPGFYKWGYALPAHSVFNVLIDIWSGGCNPQLFYGLPVLFVYEICGLALSTLGVYRRCHYAMIKLEKDANDVQGRITASIAEQEEQELSRQETAQEYPESRVSEGEPEEGARERRGTVTTIPDQGEVMEIIRREMSRPRVETATSRTNNGPCFDLPFSE
ncbi:uncharacterized protein N7458_003929 [Penicillium daleae]|uniref:DUF3533 domain-containing protein n=1 Tax=Penicillium daleae TaxID=63821 RepID=A0AAD6G4X7_9EURO|nr:uncharacterized protein N7458_003929 [Penicillium daleae]KAJ5455665.1 hypothetical protein N7458_003929 [Penicillium daleae]